MPPDIACPDPETLRQFSLGQVTGSRADPLTQHLQQCPTCSEALRVLQNGSPRISTTVVQTALRQEAGEGPGGDISQVQLIGIDTADGLGIVHPSAPTVNVCFEGTYDFLAPA
jgi:hypothetical protein